MAQLLIRLTDRPGGQAAKASGDVVDVFPDGQLQMPQPVAHWAVLQVTGLDVERAKSFLLEQDTVYGGIEDGEPVFRAVRHRLRGFDLAALPALLRTRLQSQRHATVTRATVRAFVRNRRTGLLEDL